MDDSDSRFEPDHMTLPVVTGGWCRVEGNAITLLADDGGVARSVSLADVVAVRRGGADLTLVRRNADPITITLTQVEHARAIESAVEDALASHAPESDAPRRPWWRFWSRR